MEKGLDKIWVVVPSLNPDDKLIEVMEGLLQVGFSHIILVDDGSSEEHKKYFHQAESLGVIVLSHDVNMGKGGAMKTAMRYILTRKSDSSFGCEGIVTVDGDNQHVPSDVKKVCECMLEHPAEVILGTRDFEDKHIPLRSRIGNKMTRAIFEFLCGMKLSDTQTGLRAIPIRYLEIMERVEGNRYEYETNMLLEIKKRKIPYREVKIKTVYIDKNTSSHFNPLLDSLKIYKHIIKFALSSCGASFIDLGFFSLLLFLLRITNLKQNFIILIATVGARIVSSLFNYFVNKNIVFESKNGRHTLVKYYFLCVCQMLVSYGLVAALTWMLRVTSGGVVIIKVIVDCILFLLSYQIQRRLIFN